MGNFNFKLESLLNHRRYVEDARHRAFAQTQRRVFEARQIVDSLEGEHLRLSRELKDNMQTPRPASENELYATYLASLANQIDEQRQRVREAEKVRDEQKTSLLEAVKNRKMMERLKEFHGGQFQRACLKKEQESSDEIGIQQHSRKTVNPNSIT